VSPDELAHYEEVLLARQREVEARFAEMAELCEPVAPDPAIGRLTRNDAMQDQQMALHLRRQLELQQTQLQTALDRVRKGTFGVCVLCKEPIDKGRLDVMPESPLCMPCLKKRNQKP
jgi:DnaK suppressor protein